MKTRVIVSAFALLTVVASFASSARAQVSTNLEQLRPDPYGLRGWTSEDHVQLTANGVPCANQTVYFYGYALGAFGNPGVSFRYLGYATTDRNGVATYRFVIPNDTRWSNVYLDAYFFGGPNVYGSCSEVRVRIGTNQPN